MILTEQDVIESWLSNKNIDSGIFQDIEPINIYNDWCNQYDIDEQINIIPENNSQDYIATRSNIENWHMPEEYKTLDIVDWLESKKLTDQQLTRTHMELSMFKERGMYPVLRFLIYLVDICKQNDVVLGVGRGSSVASYVLYLIGIHKVDSIKYNLDIKEFLK